MGFKESPINVLLQQHDLIPNGTKYKHVQTGTMYRITGNNLDDLTSSVGNNLSKHDLKREYVIYTLKADDGSTSTASHGELKDQKGWTKDTFFHRITGLKFGGKRKTRRVKKSKRKHTRKSKKTNKKRRSTRRR